MSQLVKLINIVGALNQFEEVAEKCLDSKLFLPQIIDDKNFYKTLTLYEENPYENLINDIKIFFQKAYVLPDKTSYNTVVGFINTQLLENTVNQIKMFYVLEGNVENLIETIKNKKNILENLSCLKDFNIKIKDLYDMKYVDFKLGKLPVWGFEKLVDIDTHSEFYLTALNNESGYIWCMVFIYKKNTDKVDIMLKTVGFQEAAFAVETDIEADTLYKKVKKETDILDNELNLAKEELTVFINKNKEDIINKYMYLIKMSKLYELKKYAVGVGNNFILNGWVLSEEAEKILNQLKDINYINCFIKSEKSIKLVKKEQQKYNIS